MDFDLKVIRRGDEIISPIHKTSDKDELTLIELLNTMIATDDEERDAPEIEKIKLVINQQQIVDIQNNNHALKTLKRHIKNKIDSIRWNKFLNQFKRSQSKLKIIDGVLVYDNGEINVPVISFQFLIEVSVQIHEKLSHIGRHKLLDIIKSNFWYPSIDKILRDICSSCEHCQFWWRAFVLFYLINANVMRLFTIVRVSIWVFVKKIFSNHCLAPCWTCFVVNVCMYM